MTGVQSSSGESDDPLLREIARYWEEIQSLADEEQRERLREFVTGAAEDDPEEALAGLTDELIDLLPPDHPVMRLLRTRTLYSGGSTAAATDLAGELRRLSMLVLPGDQVAWPGTGEYAEISGETAADDEFDRAIQARLLSLPSVTMSAVRQAGADPDETGVIRLTRPDRSVQLPAFQFAGNGRPWPVVREINERLDAAGDPWGVTCWWVDPHARLEAAPADLLGQDKDDLLTQAASFIGEDW